MISDTIQTTTIDDDFLPEEIDLAIEMARFRNDPLGFVLWAFPWGQKGTELENEYPDRWQIKLWTIIGRALEENERRAPEDRIPIQIACASGHGIGKTAFMAMTNIWFNSTNVDPQTVVTANTLTQLTTKTWREVSKWHSLMVHKHLFTWTATKFFLKERPVTWCANAIPWSKHTTESFAGTHAEAVLYEFDEGSAIDDNIYDVSEGAMTSGRCIWLVFGNPTRNTGRFRACFGKFRHRWITMSIDARTARKTNKAKIKQWIEDYGIDSDFVRVRVLGKFPKHASGQLVSEEQMDRCRKDYTAVGYEIYPISICVDVARQGDDLTTVGVWQGKKGHELKGYQKPNNSKQTTVRTATLAAKAYRHYKAKYPRCKIHIFVDDNGVGGGVTDILESWQLPVTGVDSGGASRDQKKFVNMRSGMWWDGGRAIADGYDLSELDEADYNRLKEDLVNMTYFQTVPAMKIQMEAVRDLKDRDLPSPDYATSFVMQFAHPQVLDVTDNSRADIPKRNGGTTTMQRRREQGYGQKSGRVSRP